MFSLFSKQSDKDSLAPPVLPLDRVPSNGTKMSLQRKATVTSGIKAEQERSDILQEQIVLLSEKAAQAYDKVAETEAENQRLVEKVKNLEALLKEKSHLSKRKTSNQELLDLKIKNNTLNDTILSQNIELTKLKKENHSLKSLNSTFVEKTNSLEKINKDLTIKNKELLVETAQLQSQCNDLQSLQPTSSNNAHERENSISSVSSKGSTMFSFTRNSSTEDVNRLALSPVGNSTNNHDIIAELNKKLSAVKKETETLSHQLGLEKAKKCAILENYNSFQEKTAMLANFNANYIKQLNGKIDQMKRNETLLKSKIDLMQTNMAIILSNKNTTF